MLKEDKVEEDQGSDPLEGEVVTDVSEGGEPGGTRTLRVYDKRGGGDFLIDIPSDASVTFGYFNPGKSQERNQYGRGEEERRTALRIYQDRGQKHQLAVFLGVDGFRDTSINLTRLKQKVTIETNFEDDGDGNHQASRKQQVFPRAILEAPSTAEDETIDF